jgi:hypothetical protein
MGSSPGKPISAQKADNLFFYERRISVYNESQQLINYIVATGNCTQEELERFNAVIRNSGPHLFNDDIEDYLRLLYREAVAVSLGNEKKQRLSSGPSNEEYRRTVNALSDRLVWFTHQHAKVKTVFNPFLRL